MSIDYEAADRCLEDMLLKKMTKKELIAEVKKCRSEQAFMGDAMAALQINLAELQRKIRKADRDTENLPAFLGEPRERPIDEVIDILGYHNDQYWTIVCILANYPAQRGDEDISKVVERMAKAVAWMKYIGDALMYKAPEQINACKLIASMHATAKDALYSGEGVPDSV